MSVDEDDTVKFIKGHTTPSGLDRASLLRTLWTIRNLPEIKDKKKAN
jgi:hypothetical protein